jgi:hypothetical protein
MQALGFLLEHVPVLNSGVRHAVTKRPFPLHPSGRRLIELWHAKDRELVVGRDLPSRPLGPLLQHLALCDYRAGRGDFRIRLAGFALVRRFGQDISQRYLGDVVSEEEHEPLYSAMMDVRDSGRALVLDTKATSQEQELLHSETTLLRVLAADRVTPLILAGMFFF